MTGRGWRAVALSLRRCSMDAAAGSAPPGPALPGLAVLTTARQPRLADARCHMPELLLLSVIWTLSHAVPPTVPLVPRPAEALLRTRGSRRTVIARPAYPHGVYHRQESMIMQTFRTIRTKGLRGEKSFRYYRVTTGAVHILNQEISGFHTLGLSTAPGPAHARHGASPGYPVPSAPGTSPGIASAAKERPVRPRRLGPPLRRRGISNSDTGRPAPRAACGPQAVPL